MRIAMPIENGLVGEHFGHCREFVILDVDDCTRQVVHRCSLTPPAHAPGVLPKWLSEQGVDVVLTGGIGSRAEALLRQAGITVVAGVPSGKPDDVFLSYLNNSLERTNNACNH